MINSFIHYLKSFTLVNSLTKKDSKIQTNSEKEQYKNIHFYPFSTKEWVTSIYSYNKSSSKPLVVKNFLLNIILKSYLNILQIKTRVFNRRRDNKLRYSANKVYTSRAELEYTNSKLLITLSTYNKKKSSFEHNLRKIIRLINFRTVVRDQKKIFIPFYSDRLVPLLENDFFRDNKWNIASLKEKTGLFSCLFRKKWRNLNLDGCLPIIEESTAEHLHSLYNSNNYYSRRLKNLFKLQKNLVHFTKNINFNTSLFTTVLLSFRNLGLSSFLEKLYSKKLNINLVEKRAVHLNSDIFSSAVALKLRDRKNKVVSILRKAVLMIIIPDLHTLITFDDSKETLNKNNAINNIKQQVVSGVRFEASGRLTRRLTAMRAVFKYRYAGSLKNIRSSFNNESATMLRGYLKSNLQHSLINSQTRNGTFGLKSWLSSHMLDAYPEFFNLILCAANTARANLEIRELLTEINTIFDEIRPIFETVAGRQDPHNMQLFDEYRRACQAFTIGPKTLYSYTHLLSLVLQAGWNVEYILDHFSTVTDSREIRMLEVLKETIPGCKEDIVKYFGHKLQHYNTASQMNPSDLTREVSLLLAKNPFNK